MIKTLLKDWRTCFTFREILDLYEWNEKALKQQLLRYKKDGVIFNPKKWIRVLPSHNQEELAWKLFPWGYLSLERVLFEVWVSFQWYWNSFQCIWNKASEFHVGDEIYTSFAIKKEIYENDLYIQNLWTYRKAMAVRAFCDLVYLWPKAQFDNPQYFQNDQSMKKINKLLPLYPKSTQKNVMKLITQQI